MRWSFWRSAGTSGTACPTGPGACPHKRGLDVDHVIDVSVSRRADIASDRRPFTASLLAHLTPAEVIPDRAAALANLIEVLMPAAFHNTGQYEYNRCAADHGRLKARLRPTRGLKADGTASVFIRVHGLVQNLRSGQYELGVEVAPVFWLATAFAELQPAI